MPLWSDMALRCTSVVNFIRVDRLVSAGATARVFCVLSCRFPVIVSDQLNKCRQVCASVFGIYKASFRVASAETACKNSALARTFIGREIALVRTSTSYPVKRGVQFVIFDHPAGSSKVRARYKRFPSSRASVLVLAVYLPRMVPPGNYKTQ